MIEKHGAGTVFFMIAPGPPMTRFHNHELLELLDTQKEPETSRRRGDGGHIGERTRTVAECGERGDPKKRNSEQEKTSLEHKNKMISSCCKKFANILIPPPFWKKYSRDLQ